MAKVTGKNIDYVVMFEELVNETKNNSNGCRFIYDFAVLGFYDYDMADWKLNIKKCSIDDNFINFVFISTGKDNEGTKITIDYDKNNEFFDSFDFDNV